MRDPGVYLFCGEPLVEEAIRRAGVRTSCESFDSRGTTILASGQKVLVIHNESKCGISLGEMDAFYKISLSLPLSVNRESQKGLTAIPGIGLNLAGAIVRTRETRGGFKTLDDVATVPGIGKALYRKIKPHLTL